VTDTKIWHVNWYVNQSIKYQMKEWVLLNVYLIDNLFNFTVNSSNDRNWNLKISIIRGFLLQRLSVSNTVAARSKAWTVFSRSKVWIVRSNPSQDMDVCVRLFCVRIVLCVDRILETGWSLVQGVVQTVY
jgi:hypothetical protein